MPENEVSPFDDGWQEKTRCTTKNDKKTCTCDDDEVCNGAGGVAGSVAAVVVAVAAAALAGRNYY